MKAMPHLQKESPRKVLVCGQECYATEHERINGEHFNEATTEKSKTSADVWGGYIRTHGRVH